MEFQDVSLRYDENAKLILKNISFKTAANDKIGIVGRTGAGKSSLITALFRLSEPTGKILIDNIDIGKMGLHDLRKNISIIPQGINIVTYNPLYDFEHKSISMKINHTSRSTIVCFKSKEELGSF